MLKVELLYFDDCPHWERAWIELGRALADLRLDANVQLRNVAELSEEGWAGFAGSPTIRINGRDLEGYDGPPVMACRRYLDNAGRGWPCAARLREQLDTASR